MADENDNIPWEDDGRESRPLLPDVIPPKKDADEAETDFTAEEPFDDGFKGRFDSKGPSPDWQEENHGGLTISEQVASAIAGGYTVDDLVELELYVDPLTGAPFTKARFEEAFAKHIKTAGRFAHILAMGTMFRIGVKGADKGAAPQVRALEIWLARRDSDRWSEKKQISHDVKIEVEERKQKAGEAMDRMKETMADIQRQAKEIKEKAEAEKREAELLEAVRKQHES